MTKSVITEIKDERAKLLTAEFLYGERNGALKEIPYDGSEISNRIDNLDEESLWLYGGGLSEAPVGFSEMSQSTFLISTGKTKKCPKCRGEGKVDCWACKGSGQDKSQSCRHCSGKGCRYCNGTGKATKDCAICKGSGTRQCGKCDGYRYVHTVIEVKTRFKVEDTKEHDYQGEIPAKKLKGSTGVVIFQEVANYPKEAMREMLKGGIDNREYTKLQSGVAIVFHSLIDNKIQEYDGNISLVHALVDNFFKQIPNAFKENRILEREILPVRLRIKVEDVPVKQVSYTYKAKPYSLWVYGKEQLVFAKKRPIGFTGRLVVSWIIQLSIIGLIFYWIAGKNGHHAADFQPPANAMASTPAQNNVESFEPYAKNLDAAGRGDVESQTQLGLMYAKGDGVAKSPSEAVKWFQRAADHGFARAQNNLGIMYDNGNGVAKNPILAFAWFSKAAEQGNADAQNNLGTMYGEGDGIAKDPVEAVKYFRKAAEQGQMLAQNNLALACANGDGTAKDSAEAVKWFIKAADQGYVNAQNNVGVMYDDGNGVAKNDVEAVKWFTKAAEQGFARAQNNLGARYENGLGVPKDYIQAAKWYILATAQGNEEAANKFVELAKSMTSEQIAQAQKLAKEFAPQNAGQ